MIGPFELWTTARSGERPGADGAAGAAALPVSAGFSCEHPTSSAAADAVRTARPHSLRVTPARGSGLLGAVPQVPHPVGLQVPQLLDELPMTVSKFSISAFLPSKAFGGPDAGEITPAFMAKSFSTLQTECRVHRTFPELSFLPVKGFPG